MLNKSMICMLLSVTSCVLCASSQTPQASYRWNPYAPVPKEDTKKIIEQVENPTRRGPIALLPVDSAAMTPHEAVRTDPAVQSMRLYGPSALRAIANNPEGIILCRAYLDKSVSDYKWERIVETWCDNSELFQRAVAAKKESLMLCDMIQTYNQCNGEQKYKTEVIKIVLHATPIKQLNSHDKYGQTIAHKMTGLHWNQELVEAMYACGVRFDAQTEHPDRFPSSTIAHNVIGRFRYLTHTAGHYNVQYSINAQNFLAWMFRRYPKVVGLKSKPKQIHPITCWDLLTSDFKLAIVARLTRDDNVRIGEALQYLVDEKKLQDREHQLILGDMQTMKELLTRECREQDQP